MISINLGVYISESGELKTLKKDAKFFYLKGNEYYRYYYTGSVSEKMRLIKDLEDLNYLGKL